MQYFVLSTECILLTGHRFQQLPVQPISYTDLDLFKSVHHVKLSNGDASKPIDHTGVASHHHVEPATPPLPSGGHSKLTTNLLQSLANFL